MTTLETGPDTRTAWLVCFELHGDRLSADCPAMIVAPARLDGGSAARSLMAAAARCGISSRATARATTTEFLHDILDHPRLRAADHDTALIRTLTTVSRVAS
ncbi:hypothetical protein [Nocardia sp. R7R-8]|uniref:hypothetical protein n=1 Tax=Nocardia sp. R7R-8 TaxID=3459304 RepID=UPI00403DFFA1